MSESLSKDAMDYQNSFNRVGLLGRVDAAKYLGVSVRTIDNFRKQKVLRPVYIGNRPMFPVKDLDEYIDSLRKVAV